MKADEQGRLERAIGGALRATLHDHGPITAALITSAVKRIVGKLANAWAPDEAAAAILGREAGLVRKEGSPRCRRT